MTRELCEQTGLMVADGGAVEELAAGLKEHTRARVPLDWAATQSNLGHAIQIMRERRRA